MCVRRNDHRYESGHSQAIGFRGGISKGILDFPSKASVVLPPTPKGVGFLVARIGVD